MTGTCVVFTIQVLLGDACSHKKISKNTVFYSDCWLKHHQHLGFELFLDQFCEDQAYNSLITRDTLCFLAKTSSKHTKT